MDEPIFTVSALNDYIKSMMDQDMLLSRIAVQGEISNYKIYPSGHHYFSLKDDNATVRCVCFRSCAEKLRFRPENGMSVTAVGRVSVYPKDGSYQLYVNSLIPKGMGDLQMAFEQLKARLGAEGLFDPAHKIPLPSFPESVAVITSGAGAAVHDIIRIMGKRWPLTKIKVLPVRVQGEGAAAEIAGAIRYANRYHVADLIITGRGGGSMEDLWAFNEENVARAIYESEIPVISAVGHEPDVTIADYVADRRAATPSNAAEIAVPDQVDVLAGIAQDSLRMVQAMNSRLEACRRRLEELSARPVFRDPEVYLGTKAMALDSMRTRLLSAGEKLNGEKRRSFVSLAAKMEALSPLKVLTRGYAIAEQEGKPLRSVQQMVPGDSICVILSDGSADCTVKEVHSSGREKSDV